MASNTSSTHANATKSFHGSSDNSDFELVDAQSRFSSLLAFEIPSPGSIPIPVVNNLNMDALTAENTRLRNELEQAKRGLNEVRAENALLIEQMRRLREDLGLEEESICISANATNNNTQTSSTRATIGSAQNTTTTVHIVPQPLKNLRSVPAVDETTSTINVEPPKTVAEAQLLDLLGMVGQPRADRPAVPPNSAQQKKAECRICHQWLCNPIFLQLHMQKKHGIEPSAKKPAMDGKQSQQPPLIVWQHEEEMDKDELLGEEQPQNTTEQTPPQPTIPSIGYPRQLQPPKGQIEIQWEEETSDSSEQEDFEEEARNALEELIGSAEGGEEQQRRLQQFLHDERSQLVKDPSFEQCESAVEDSLSGQSSCHSLIPHSKLLASKGNAFRNGICLGFTSSSSSGCDSEGSSSTSGNGSLSSIQGTIPDENASNDGVDRDSSRFVQSDDDGLDHELLQRLLHVSPPHRANDAQQNLEPEEPYPCPPVPTLQPVTCKKQAYENRQIQALNQKLDQLRVSMNAQLRELRDELHAEEECSQTRFWSEQETRSELMSKLRNLECELNQLAAEEFNERFDWLEEQNELLLERTNNLRKEFERLEPLCKKAVMLEYVENRMPVEKREDGSMLIAKAPFLYCDEFKQFILTGHSLCTGLAMSGAARFAGYPVDLFDQLLEHALRTPKPQQMLEWTVLNFDPANKAEWPRMLRSGTNPAAERLPSGIKKRAVRKEKVVYTFRNTATGTRFVLDVYFSQRNDLNQRMHCFSYRRLAER